jgi:hypothetical protein
MAFSNHDIISAAINQQFSNANFKKRLCDAFKSVLDSSVSPDDAASALTKKEPFHSDLSQMFRKAAAMPGTVDMTALQPHLDRLKGLESDNGGGSSGGGGASGGW